MQNVPLPQRRDEAWRFADLKRATAVQDFVSSERADDSIQAACIGRSQLHAEIAGKLVFVNEDLALDERPSNEGLICAPLAEAVAEHSQRMQEFFMTQDATLGSEKFALLHKSRTRSGVFIYVPPGMEIDLPIEIYHHVSGAQTSAFPHTLIVTGENAKVTVIDHYLSASDSESHLSCAVVDLVAGSGSQLRYVARQDLSESSSNIHLTSTLAGADADVKSLQLHLGSAWSRTESVSHLNGKGANSDMLSVALPAGTQEVDQRTLQHHAEPHTTSDLLYKNALSDQSRSVFAGLIMVDEGAHYTDAYQTCRNLMLSDEAEANAMPGLEINADQVKCSHGSTSGPITDEEVFYFNARGIATEAAKRLITLGFAAEVFAKLGDAATEVLLNGLVEQKFARRR